MAISFILVFPHSSQTIRFVQIPAVCIAILSSICYNIICSKVKVDEPN
ncbi:hypothetical protein AB434_3529 [Heyndrickxia coagulans]|uniref:Uncharacterized protein n=1 Tax=Heyndrickxia coagulans TaxID=1398 RepID=A0AAN0WBN7_HEYCO|nr:hypothetical protein SB48_HM08orf02765 [Heyndrickxia coagulans]AKN55934.1 hypothetical protein AB434_3529 [Heyndrickxia coagulans]